MNVALYFLKTKIFQGERRLTILLPCFKIIILLVFTFIVRVNLRTFLSIVSVIITLIFLFTVMAKDPQKRQYL